MLSALVQENVVVSIQDLTEEQTQQLSGQYEAVLDISIMNPQPIVGWVLQGNQLVPGPDQSATPVMKITKLALNQRFTIGEMLALMSYVNSNPASIVALLMQRLQLATYVDLNRTDTIAAMGVLVSLSLLTSDRRTAILTTLPSPDEVYRGQ